MLYRQIHLFIGDAFHVLPCTHYQAILLYITFFLQAYFLHISLKAHLSKQQLTIFKNYNETMKQSLLY